MTEIAICVLATRVQSHLSAPVLATVHSRSDLTVDQVRGDRIWHSQALPRSKHLLAVDELPRSISLCNTTLGCVLLALRYCIHHVIPASFQSDRLK